MKHGTHLKSIPAKVCGDCKKFKQRGYCTLLKIKKDKTDICENNKENGNITIQ